MERRLAAVVIADVAGYGRLSQTDEEGTRPRLAASAPLRISRDEIFARSSDRAKAFQAPRP
jgi:hypothetical protein